MVTKSLLGVAKRLVRHELAVLLVSAPLLLFPSPLSAIPLVAIIAVWFSRWFATGHVTRRTGLELPILAIVFLLPVSVLTSIDPKLSLPKLLGLLLGVACFYGIVNASHFEKRIPALAGLISAAGVFVSVAGALGMARAEKLMPLWSLQSGLAVFRGGADVLERAFNPNEVGGTLAMLIPFALSIVVFSKERRVRIVTGASLGMMLPTLVFTQSRWAFVTTAVVSLCVLALRNRRVWLVFPTGAIAAVGFAWLAGPTRLLESLDYLGSTGSAAGRVEIWQRAFYVIQDFPLTGVGLNTFVPVTQRLYPYFLVPNYNFGHAHNIFLQLALDLGLPGLAAGIGLFASLIYVWKGGLPSVRGKRLEGAYVGFMALISAYLIFGLLDAIAFGAKPSVLVWAAAGGIVATRIGVESQERPEDVRPVRARGIRWSLSRAGKVALSAASVLGLALALYGTPLAVGTFYRNLGNVQLAKAVLGNDSGAMASSENLLQRSLRWNPQDSLSWRSLGQVYLARQSTDQAIDALSKATGNGATGDLAYFHLGNAYDKAGQTAQAIAAWRRAGAGEYFVKQGEKSNSEQKYAEAEREFGIAHTLGAESYQSWYGLGFARLRQGDAIQAIQDLKRAVALGPEEIESYVNLGDAYGVLKDYQEGEYWYKKGMEIEPDNPVPYLRLGINYFGHGEYVLAAGQLRTALEKDERHVFAYAAHLYLARSYVNLNQLQQAIAEYERAIALRPDAGSYLELGAVHLRAGQYAEASKEFQEALRLNPDNVEARRQLEQTGESLKGPS